MKPNVYQFRSQFILGISIWFLYKQKRHRLIKFENKKINDQLMNLCFIIIISSQQINKYQKILSRAL